MSVLPFRSYRVRKVFDSEFIATSSDKNDRWAVEDLIRSGLTPEDMQINSQGNLMLPSFAQAGYLIPYFDFEGRILVEPGTNFCSMYRIRLKVSEFCKEPKYIQPTKEDLAKFGLPSSLPYLIPYPKAYDNGTIYCVEGEKKTAAVIKFFKVAAFGIPGCQMWRNPNGLGGVHPWILEYLKMHNVKKICIIPDSDIHRYDMGATYGTFADILKREYF